MNPSYFIPIFLLLFILIWSQNQQSRMFVAKKFIKHKTEKDNGKMLELAKRFIDKECIIYTFNSNQMTGIIREVTDGALMIENKGTLEAVNIDFVIRIREYPKNKNGKKKSVVID